MKFKAPQPLVATTPRSPTIENQRMLISPAPDGAARGFRRNRFDLSSLGARVD
jgi:hypothetical protein